MNEQKETVGQSEKATWVMHKYGSGETLYLGYDFRVTVIWDDHNYKVTINNASLKQRFDEMEPAKRFAVTAAKQVLQKIYSRLNECN